MRRQQRNFAASGLGREWAAKRENLPVYQVRDRLLATLKTGHMAVLSGDTGCGKTTQVPQYLLETEIENGRGATCSIVCTQPRRIAAMSVADRVAQERAEPPPGKRGSRVGCVSMHVVAVVLLCSGASMTGSRIELLSQQVSSNNSVGATLCIRVERSVTQGLNVYLERPQHRAFYSILCIFVMKFVCMMEQSNFDVPAGIM